MNRTSSVVLRPYTEHDQDAVTAIHHAIYPEYEDANNQWRPGQQFDNPPTFSNRYVACDREPIMGYAAIREQYPARYRLNLMVHPAHQQSGVGRCLLTRLHEDAKELKAITLQARVRSDQPAALRFLTQWRFSEVHRMRGMTLSIPNMDFDKLRPVLNRVLSNGFEISTLAQEKIGEKDWLIKLYELNNEVIHGWPYDDPTYLPATGTLSEFTNQVNQYRKPDRFFIAKAAGQYVGFTTLFDLGTGVHPSYRAQGIATALKIHSLQVARQHGPSATWTTTANPAMFAVNEKLGYRHLHTEVRLIKILDESFKKASRFTAEREDNCASQ